MGMDVYGRNPRQNKPLSEFPVYYKFKDMDFKDKWEILDKKVVCEECQGEDCGAFVNEDGDCWKCEGRGHYNPNEKLKEEYWKEMENYEEVNVGYYFRNNVWWWRPLWNYCYAVAEDLLENNLQVKEYEVDDNGETDYEKYHWVPAKYEDGHGNSGAGLNAHYAKELGEILLKQIEIGGTIQYQASYEQQLEDIPDDDCFRCNNNNRGNNKKEDCTNCNKTGKTTNFNKNYPFDIDNVKDFAEFCLQSGGFKIC